MAEPAREPADAPSRAELELRHIGAQALTSNLTRVSELERALRAAARSALAQEERAAAAAVAHQLVGSAGTFGYRRVSQLARELEEFFLTDGGDQPSAEVATRRIATIQQDLLAGPDEDDLGA